jgi:decaprenyl-phosphate phosphoribosyltransferase
LIKYIILSSRPKQWIKSALIAVVPIISGEFLKFGLLQYLKLVLAILSFILLSSAIYFLNDLKDINYDRLHSSKSKRPIASGKIPKSIVIICAIIFIFIAQLIGIFVAQNLFYLQLTYLLINVSYIVAVRNIPFWEMIAITTGFIIRGAVGVVFVNSNPSYFFYIIIFSIAFTIICAKRLGEISSESTNKRKVISSYTRELMSGCIIIATSFSIVMYTLFIFSSTTKRDDNYLSNVMFYLTIIPFFIIVLEIMKIALSGKSEIVEEIYLKNLFLYINFLILIIIYLIAVFI